MPTVHSTDSPRTFFDRQDAGEALGSRLYEQQYEHPLVIGVARGGVEVGFAVAKRLQCQLLALSVRKITHPDMPEFALGAAVSDGTILIGREAKQLLSEHMQRTQIANAQREAARRQDLYDRVTRWPEHLSRRTVLLVDDGIATGYTVASACRSLRARGALRIVVAAPVASAEAVRYVSQFADEVITLLSPQTFLGAVGGHFQEFPQRTDSTVIALLRMAHQS